MMLNVQPATTCHLDNTIAELAHGMQGETNISYF